MLPSRGSHDQSVGIALGIVFESIFGYNASIRAVDSVSRADFGLIAVLYLLRIASTLRIATSMEAWNGPFGLNSTVSVPA